ncbi:hypothetical protein F2Q70_00022956 [Brassica cretica]|uniref:Replication factor A C-terminal domain-containing protein n=1 Tax=Brassica cretica TaxID=69181 RepID=A0A8S9GLE8_BRACR|nr:hypothetical protein F2Q70_00022956 [Brassica cretica]
MLLIDEQGSVIQGFIPPSRIERYLPKMKPGSLYKLNIFYGSSNKTVYRVSDHAVTVSFSWNSELSVLEDSPTPFDDDRFRFHSFEDFQASCDRKGDLYDVVGHMKLVNGQCLIGTPVLDEVEIARARHVLVHVHGPVMKLYLWDQAARDFCKKFKSYEGTPTMLLVTTVNTKSLGGTLALTSMSSSRVFMDYDVQPTVDYFSWLGSNPQSAELVNAEVITKRETLTIGEIFSYIKDGSNKCTATIDDVVHGSTWYYISCSGCHTKATKGPTSLMCSKCGKVNISGVPQYRAQISVYDNSEQAVFVLLGDAGFELTGKHAAELVSSYFEANGDQGVTQEVPFPEAFSTIDVVGQIVIIQKIKPYHPELNIDATIGLQLNRSTIVKLILCDKQATDFSILQRKKDRKFRVVIITSIIPKLFQGKLLLRSSSATNFYFNKSINYIKHFKRQIRDHAKPCSKE